MKYDTKTNAITIYAASFAAPFLYSFLLWKGWTALAPHLNCPLFGYWEVFCIATGFRWLFSHRGK